MQVRVGLDAHGTEKIFTGTLIGPENLELLGVVKST